MLRDRAAEGLGPNQVLQRVLAQRLPDDRRISPHALLLQGLWFSMYLFAPECVLKCIAAETPHPRLQVHADVDAMAIAHAREVAEILLPLLDEQQLALIEKNYQVYTQVGLDPEGALPGSA